jgi:hypothetical protein
VDTGDFGTAVLTQCEPIEVAKALKVVELTSEAVN